MNVTVSEDNAQPTLQVTLETNPKVQNLVKPQTSSQVLGSVILQSSANMAGSQFNHRLSIQTEQ